MHGEFVGLPMQRRRLRHHWPMGSDEYRVTQADAHHLRSEIHIYEGLFAVLTRWPEVSALAFESDHPDDMVEQISELLALSRLQAQSVAEMQIRRLSSMERSAVGRRLDESKERLAAVLAQLGE